MIMNNNFLSTIQTFMMNEINSVINKYSNIELKKLEYVEVLISKVDGEFKEMTMEMFNKQNRYVSREANSVIDIRLQLIMWELIDELKAKGKVDYLQIFRISKEDDKKIIIEHEQEVPKYKEKYSIELLDVEITCVIKVYAIDSVEYSTMILAEEY